MFGAKFKKWIEIVNPRKKSNKKKNGNSGNILTPHITNDFKGAVFQNETTSISSPARRSEISPIQNHNGRRGWHSPNQENPVTATPNKLNKEDCPQPLTISKTEDIYRLQNENISKNCANDLSKSNNTINNYLPTAPTNFAQMKEIDQSMMHSNTSATNKNHILINTNKSTSNVNNNTIHINKNRLYSPSRYYSTTATNSSNEILNDTHTYLNGSSSSSVNLTKLKIHNDTNDNKILTTKQQRCEESKYGKIQPINKYISKYRFFSTKAATASPTSKTIDQYNGNSSDDFYSVEYAVKTLPKSTTTKNSLLNDSHTKMLRNCDEKKISNEQADSIKRSNEYHYKTVTTKSPTQNFTNLNCKNLNAIYSNEKNSNNFGTSLKPPSLPTLAAPVKYNNSTIQQGHLNNQNRLSYHIINHVSSPESAYSTGYSTDGNSPGSVDSYYINIRTGIHYFPRSQNSSNCNIDSNLNRFKSDLNRIEEKNDEHQIFNSHKRGDSFDMGRNSNTFSNEAFRKSNVQTHEVNRCQSPILRSNILEMSQLRTPSPRQRSRIRTNPWISIESEAQNPPCSTFDLRTNLSNNNNNNDKKDRDSTGSTTSSSGINVVYTNEISDSESSSTEKPSKMLKSPKMLTRLSTKKDLSSKLPISISTTQHEGSDDDATLNEIGKFDESYVYEKDFLSDSDQTDCVSDLGQEAGDECESTDDVIDGKKTLNQLNDNSKSKKISIKNNKEQLKKRKKFVRKRSKHLERINKSPIVSRGCRSVGGTPVSVRRNEKMSDRRKIEPLIISHRSNSLTFNEVHINEVHMIHNRMLAISNSEKALIKADLEADVKYRQLINEAESILISMKSNLLVPKETIPSSAISSPRKNVPTNKRVEILRNCEFDLKRELVKTANKITEVQPTLINKRLEQLRYDTPISAPTSPKSNRAAPMKTHVTNFIYQNEKDFISSQKNQKTSNSTSSTPFFNKSLPFNKKCIDSDSESENCKLGPKTVFNNENAAINKIPLFRSVMRNNDDMFFPQSEPLKRKIYSRNSKREEIQESVKEDFDSDFPKKALLYKIEMLRQERQQKSKDNRESSSDSNAVSNDSPKRVINDSFKRKLIMKTIEDIKRSLEDQSLELNEIQDSDT